MTTGGDHESLFSYGILRKTGVQVAVFGRELLGRPDAVAGYAVHELVITDPTVIERSGTDRHPILRPAGPESRIEGIVFDVTFAELAAADTYEVDDYSRVRVVLESGVAAWVYVYSAE